jgi:hypothetical protein
MPYAENMPTPGRRHSSNPELERVVAEIVNRLHTRGVEVLTGDSAEDIAALLDAVEAFERAVQEAGGDLMVAEPAEGYSEQPDDSDAVAPGQAAFMIPGRKPREPIEDYLARLGVATESVQRFQRDRGER